MHKEATALTAWIFLLTIFLDVISEVLKDIAHVRHQGDAADAWVVPVVPNLHLWVLLQEHSVVIRQTPILQLAKHIKILPCKGFMLHFL